MNTYKDVLGGIPSEPAWDVFILYGPDARWDGERPPAPAYWMHQLGTAKRPRATGPYWNAEVFRQAVLSQRRP
jgi:hypothetical protein